MLTVSDYNNLKLLYDKFFKFNIQIKILIEQGDWDSVESAVHNKGLLMNQIIFFERSRIEDIKSNPELMKLRNKLIELEKENIVLVQTEREKTLSDLHNVKKVKKVLNAYHPQGVESVSTFEFNQDD